MNRSFKKFISVICVIAMIVSSITVYNQREIKAAAPDWSTVEWIANGVPGKDYTDKYKFYCEGSGINKNNIQNPASVSNFNDCIHLQCPGTITSCSLGTENYSSQGTGLFVYLKAFTARETEFTVTCDNGQTYTCYVYYAGTDETVLPVTSVTATGKVNSIDVSWTPQGTMPAGTQYYVYLDEETTERAVVTDAVSTTLTGISAGQHIITVKAYVNGVFSEPAQSPYATVIAGETKVTNLVVSSTKPNQIDVSLDSVFDAEYKIELLNSTGEVVQTITECTVAENKASCIFTGVEKGTYTVRATVTVGDKTDTGISNSVEVKNPEAQEVDEINFDTTAYNKVIASWTVVNNAPVTGQKYKVYLDGTYVSETDAMTYTFDAVSTGRHTVKITAILGSEETPGREEEVVATAGPITVMGTSVNQVTNYNLKHDLNENWSYEYPIISTDCYLGVDADNNIIAYSPLNRNESNFIYQSMTGLEIGKYYTYSYTVQGSKEGMAEIPVHVYSDISEVDHTVIPGTEGNPAVISRTFCADIDKVTIRYDVGKLADGTAVKISPVTVTKVTPADVTNLEVTGRVDAIDVSWTKNSSAIAQQTYTIYITNAETSEIVQTIPELTSDSYKVRGLESGNYTVTIKGFINGEYSAGVISETVAVGGSVAAVTSSELAVEGFQIKTNDTASQTSVAFRAICKGPQVGSQITASDGTTYTIAGVGTVYALDVNGTGYKKNNKLNPLYTLLDSAPVENQEYAYIGANSYDGNNRTYGYLATQAGYMNNWNPDDTTHTYYVRTIDKMDVMMAYSMHVRAFAVATDGTIIYGEQTAATSVAQIADHLYKNSKSNNYTAHRYLYNKILNSPYLTASHLQIFDSTVEANNIYYRDTILDYGWNGNLYVPTVKSATLTTDTLEELNSMQ